MDIAVVSGTDRYEQVLREMAFYRADLERLCAEHPEARDLVATNPALALCVARAAVWDTLSELPVEGRVDRLLRVKRATAAGMLGFPATESAVRVLARIEPDGCAIPLLMRLRRVMQQEELLALLRHFRVITFNMLAVLMMWEWGRLGSVRLIEQIAAASPDGFVPRRIGMLLDETDRLLGRCQRSRAPIPDLATLEKLHNRLVVAVLVRHGKKGRRPDSDYPFPAAPVAGTPWLVPIVTVNDLHAEGREQSHCAGTLAEEVMEGRRFVYRVLEPERATLSLRKRDDVWVLDQLFAAGNRPVLAATQRAVEKWLRENTPAAAART